MFKNTFKLLLNNFSTVWKILLYKIITIICIMGLTTVVCLPIINQLLNQNFFVFMQNNLSKLFLNFNLNDFVDILVLIIKKLFEIISNANLVALFVSAGSISIVAYYFVSNLIVLPVTDDVRSYMSNNLKLGFMNCYVSNFGKSLKYASLKTVTIFVLNIALFSICGLIYYGLSLSVKVIAPIVAISFMLVVFSLKTTLLIGVETALTVHNCTILEALKRSLKSLLKKSVSIFSNSLIIYISLLILNMFGIFFTFGATNILIIPMSILIIIIFKNVAYYECNGMRYYIDRDSIAMPKTLEEQDKFKKVIDII